MITLEGFSEILSAYYVEQHIGRIWVQVQPVYNHEIDQIHDSVSQIVFVATNYLRRLPNPGDPRTFTIIVEPLVGRITNVRNFQDHYAIVLERVGGRARGYGSARVSALSAGSATAAISARDRGEATVCTTWRYGHRG